MKKMIVSILLTLLLGPGAGHIYLRKFRKGLLFILTALLFALYLAWQMAKTFSQNVSSAAGAPELSPTQLMQNFSASYPGAMLYYDIALAALWAYTIYDAYLIARAQLPQPVQDDTEQT